MTPELVLSIIASLLAVGSGIYGWRNSRADTSKLYTEAAANLITPLKERVDELEEQLDALKAKNAALVAQQDIMRQENASLRAGIVVLIGQLRDMGVRPKWTP